MFSELVVAQRCRLVTPSPPPPLHARAASAPWFTKMFSSRQVFLLTVMCKFRITPMRAT
jgi:hypothetical protein